MKKEFYVYQIPPIDFGWQHLKSIEETTIDIVKEFIDICPNKIKTFLDDWKIAMNIARMKGWEGDFHEKPRVFWIPEDTELLYGFLIKQNNNGTTFAIFEKRIPHLEELALDWERL